MRFEIRFSRDSNLKDSKFYFVQPYHSPKSKRALSVPKKLKLKCHLYSFLKELNKDMTLLSQENCMYAFPLIAS